MRFLCLHGMGTSAKIFHNQTSSFRKLLGDGHTFDFVNAPNPSPPAHGLPAFFPPPNYTFWQTIDPGDIAGTHRWLEGILAERGPYDALICFSQGCYVVASFILHHNNECPEEPLPFGGAMFICGGMPLAALEDLSLPVSRKAWKNNNRTGELLDAKAGAAMAEIEKLLKSGRAREASRKGLWDQTDDLCHEVSELGDCHELPELPQNDVYGLNLMTFPDALKIDIPTVHVYGIKDPRYTASIHLASLSDERKRLVYDHGGGHEIPRNTKVSKQLADAVNWLDEQIRIDDRK